MVLLGCTSEGDPQDTGEMPDSAPDTLTTEIQTDSETENETVKETETETETETEKKETSPMDIWNYKLENGVFVREITIDSGKGGLPVEIVQLTDIHINYCTAEDLEDPVLKSTYENRKWLANFKVKDNLLRCLRYADGADQLVITGDLLDYLSLGAIEKAQEYIFDPYPNVMACLGNHDPVKKMQGTVAETTTLEERLAVLTEVWPHDAYYESRVLGEKAMLIVMDNASEGGIGSFHESQLPLLEADLTLAREKGYSVLLFYHIPLSTGNPVDKKVKATLVGDTSATERNFFDACVGRTTPGVSGEIYRLIVNNADLIKGAFCGHHHSDFYTEIYGKGIDGSIVTIPQYAVTGVPYVNGNVMKITVK
jgi:hypothetical protein